MDNRICVPSLRHPPLPPYDAELNFKAMKAQAGFATYLLRSIIRPDDWASNASAGYNEDVLVKQFLPVKVITMCPKPHSAAILFPWKL